MKTEDELTLDHVQPISRGGDDSSGNIVTACTGCNAAKGRQRLATFLAENETLREHFMSHARHVWKRHLRALEEEVAARLRKPRPRHSESPRPRR